MYPHFFTAIMGRRVLAFSSGTFSFAKLQGAVIARNKVTANYEPYVF